MIIHRRLSDSKSPQVSRILLSILAVFNNGVVWMVTTSKSSRPFNNPLVTVPEVPITIGIIVTFMFHCFFNSLARSRYLSPFIIIIIIIIASLFLVFFTERLSGGLSLESNRQQVSSCHCILVDQCCSLDDLNSSYDFQFRQSFSQPFGTVSSALTTTGT